MRLSLITVISLQFTSNGAIAAFVPAAAVSPSQRATRGGAPLAQLKSEEQGFLMDTLMHRAVEKQVNAFVLVRDVSHKRILVDLWQSYKAAQSTAGSLTHFLDVLHRMAPTEVFVPSKGALRQLSPGNPFAQPQGGYFIRVEPARIALRLMDCRKTLALSWAAALHQLGEAPSEHLARRLGGGSPVGEAATDEQLLRGLATRLAAQDLLRELSLLPSQAHVHEWFATFVLSTHARDLTREGSVEALLADLAAQPPHLRGGALVDPREMEREIVGRTAKIFEDFAEGLHEAPHEHLSVSSRFLESCLALP